MNNIKNKLDKIKEAGNYRELRDIDGILGNGDQLNMASNDYLGIGENSSLIEEFIADSSYDKSRMSAVSSRLLTGNHNEYLLLESLLERLYGRPALFFGSGYHANSGVIPALCDKNSLILADKLSHASMIDGIRLAEAKTIRYRHNDYVQLEKLVAENAGQFESVFIITESIFSMDGDEADLNRLVEIKSRYNNVYLYVDEAHSVGVRGRNGLGCCEESGLTDHIDIILGTCGKALASTGAYVICNDYVREYLINACRTMIFTTALPPVNVAWTRFIIEKLPEFEEKRMNLDEISATLHKYLRGKGKECESSSHIIPVIIGESDAAVDIAEKVREEGFFVLPVRPPTVPKGTARLRLSLSASHTAKDIERLISVLDRYI